MESVIEKQFNFAGSDYRIDENGELWKRAHKVTMDNGYQHVQSVLLTIV